MPSADWPWSTKAIASEGFDSPDAGHRALRSAGLRQLVALNDSGRARVDPPEGAAVRLDDCSQESLEIVGSVALDSLREIESRLWDVSDLKWPIKGKTKPDLIIFDPPYFKKKADDYDAKSISGCSREEYLSFLEYLFALAHENAKKTTQLAFINADWRDFQSTPARN